MSDWAKFDYDDFISNGFTILDDHILEKYFGSREQTNTHKYAMVKVLEKHEAVSVVTCITFNSLQFFNNIVHNLTQVQQEELRESGINVPFVDDDTRKSYNIKLAKEANLYKLTEMGNVIKDKGLKYNQQIGLDVKDGVFHFKCL